MQAAAPQVAPGIAQASPDLVFVSKSQADLHGMFLLLLQFDLDGDLRLPGRHLLGRQQYTSK